jgi:hypothetical protein
MGRRVVRPWLEIVAWIILIVMGFVGAMFAEAAVLLDAVGWRALLADVLFFSAIGVSVVLIGRALTMGAYALESDLRIRGIFRTRTIRYESIVESEPVTVPGIRTGTYNTPEIRFRDKSGRERSCVPGIWPVTFSLRRATSTRVAFRSYGRLDRAAVRRTHIRHLTDRTHRMEMVTRSSARSLLMTGIPHRSIAMTGSVDGSDQARRRASGGRAHG